jgi:DNA transformation protein
MKKKLKDCKNLGKTIIRNLEKVDIKSYSDLQKVGPVEIYKRLTRKFPDKTWPVCYYLYSLEGALIDMHWDEIGKQRKEKLRKSIE